jgi:hypothetical protein
MGRKPSGKPHRKPIQVKLNDEERAFCDERAARHGLDTSTWMRLWCLSAPASAPLRPKLKNK